MPPPKATEETQVAILEALVRIETLLVQELTDKTDRRIKRILKEVKGCHEAILAHHACDDETREKIHTLAQRITGNL